MFGDDVLNTYTLQRQWYLKCFWRDGYGFYAAHSTTR